MSRAPGRVLVTGGTGFIGWHVCERFRDAGWQVAAVARPGSRKPVPRGVERTTANLDAAALTRAGAGAGIVVHAAGLTHARSEADYRHVNVEGTRAVAEAAAAVGARLVHVSSLTASGPAPVDRPKIESETGTPITPYGWSKQASEAAVAGVPGLRWVIVRPAAVYGPRDRQFLPLFRTARLGFVLRPFNAATFWLTLVHVDDLSRAIELAARCDAVDRETLFVGHPEAASLDRLLGMVADAVGRSCRAVPVPAGLIRLGAWLGVGGLSAERVTELSSPGFVCGVERAERQLGFRAGIDLASGLRSTAAWYRANRWLS